MHLWAARDERDYRAYWGALSGIEGTGGIGGATVPVPDGTVAVGADIMGGDIMGAAGMLPGGTDASGAGGVPARALARLLAFRSSVVGEPMAAS